MKINAIQIQLLVFLLTLAPLSFSQTINLNSAASYAIYSTGGAVTNSGTIYKTRVTGNVGTSSDPTLPGFGNIDGKLTTVSNGSANLQLNTDVLSAYSALNTATPSFFPAPSLGSGQILVPGVYAISAPSVLSLDLILDAQNNPNAVFIIQISGAFSSTANAKVKLINGALACNVYWKVEGAVSLGAGTHMKGTIIANNGAIVANVGDTLEGRAIAIQGAISVTELFAYLPTGCGSPILTGPTAPTLANAGCFALFTSNGANANSGASAIIGDVGTNGPSDLTTGYNPLTVTGTIHPIPDVVTAQAAADLLLAYNYLVGLNPGDIELMRPELFGHHLILTPHTYLMQGAVTFTDTLYLDARGNANAVFIINVNGAFGSTANSKVVLLNGTQAKNVFWKIDGAVSLATNSIFKGTIVANGAISLMSGVDIAGRALSISGALNVAAVTVSMPTSCSPVIVTSPLSQTVCLGSAASFSVSATGVNLSYQWRKGSVNIVNGANISGANTATLSINPTLLADAASDYNVVITGSYAPNVSSANVSLSFNTPPSITTQPLPQTLCLGAAATMSVAATGTGLSYQWRKGNVNLIDGANISGSNTAILSINPSTLADAATNYNVVVTGLCPSAQTSLDVALTVQTPPSITTQPLPQTLCLGSAATMSVAATGTGLSYQWRKGNVNLLNGATISGSNTSVLSINPTTLADAASNYNVVVTGLCPSAQTSLDVALSIQTPPSITTQPLPQTLCLGAAATMSVAATGTGLSYQWRKGNVNLIDGANITGSITAILSINPTTLADAATNYNVVVSGLCPSAQTSLDAALVVQTPTSIGAQPNPQTVCLGAAATMSVAATGTGLSYQWRKGNVNLIDGANISGSNTAILSINPTTLTDAATNYNVVVSGLCASAQTSLDAELTLQTAPSIGTQPNPETVCLGAAATMSVVAAGSGLSYQWRKGNVNLIDGANVSGSNTAILSINPTTSADAATNYNVVVTGLCPSAQTSLDAELTLQTAPSIGTQPIPQTACLGAAATMSVVATGTGLSYQWRKGNVNLLDDANISGSNTAVLSINPTTLTDAATNYNVVVTGLCPSAQTSLDAALVVPDLTQVAILTDTIACLGNDLQLQATAIDSLSYLWVGPNDFSSDSSNPNLTNLNATQAGSYQLLVSLQGCTSNPIVFNLNLVNCDATDFFIPEGFSPNQDGINDLFVIRGIQDYPQNKLLIYSRWGDRLFEADAYANNWDGTSSFGLIVGSELLPIGNYFYILQLNNSADEVFKGVIYLSR